MCFEDLEKPRTLNTAISGVKSFAKKKWQTNGLLIKEPPQHPGTCWASLGNLLPLTAFRFMSLRSTLNSLIPKISGGPISPGDCNSNTAGRRLAVLKGFCSSDQLYQLRQMVLIQNQSWLISSYTKPTLSVNLWSSRHLRGLHTSCGTTMDEWLSKSHPFK